MLREPANVRIDGTISFHNEHGVFLSDEFMKKLNIQEGDPVLVTWRGIALYEICKPLSEIDPKNEARAILAAFEDIVSNHYSFLAAYKITERLPWKETLPFAFDIGKICPDLKIKTDSLFTWIYRKLEDILIELDGIPFGAELPRNLRKAIKSQVDELAQTLEDLYHNANCAIGAGPYLSLTLRNLETAFGISEMELSYLSKFGYNKPVAANPYVLYWLINALGYFHRKKLHWNYYNFEIESIKRPSYIPITELMIKAYLPSAEFCPLGAVEKKVRDYLYGRLMKEKPFILPQDVLFPISCPSIVVRAEYEENKTIPFVETTPYGPLPYGTIQIPKFDKETKIIVQFFDFPLFNKKRPVVLDTSALDITRFPYDIKSPFFTAFLKDRTVILPAVVLYEAKTRHSTKDRDKVAKALYRLNQLKSLGFIKDVVKRGHIPESLRITSGKGKKLLEDLVDAMVLSTAIENNGILFTNDHKLAEFAFSWGVYPISYNGLEDDVRAVVKGNQLKYDKETVIEAVQRYGQYFRSTTYEEEDIKAVVETLIKRGEIGEVQGKLYYFGLKKREGQ